MDPIGELSSSILGLTAPVRPLIEESAPGPYGSSTALVLLLFDGGVTRFTGPDQVDAVLLVEGTETGVGPGTGWALDTVLEDARGVVVPPIGTSSLCRPLIGVAGTGNSSAGMAKLFAKSFVI